MKPVTVLIAPDSFKEALSATQVVQGIVEGWSKVYPRTHFICCPFSDGGEGFLDAVATNVPIEIKHTTVTDLTGKKRRIPYGWSPKSNTAIIETAHIVGLHLVPPHRRTPEKFTSYGVGEIILKVIQRGAEEIVVGLGGSGVNDGGAGIAQALGYTLLDSKGTPLSCEPLALENVSKIIISPHRECILSCSIIIASDVKNPYYGPKGATFTYGPQKGLSKDLCPRLDSALKRFAEVIRKDLNINVQRQPGSGSAGGMGGALFAFAGGKFVPGFKWLAQVSQLEKKIQSANLIITGEGQLDKQSMYGKVVGEIIQLANHYDKPVIVLVGRLGDGWQHSLISEKVFVFPVAKGEFDKDLAIKNSYENIVRTTEHVAKVIRSLGNT